MALLWTAPQARAMGKPTWTVMLQPCPMPDGHERLVRALRVLIEGAPSQAQPRRSAPRARGLDDCGDEHRDPLPVGSTLTKEGQR